MALPRRAARSPSLTFADPEGPIPDFNPAQWARDHERLDALRFEQHRQTLDSIIKMLWLAGGVLIAVLGWSLKTQYDSMALSAQHAQEQLVAIQGLQKTLAK